ncbi:MAG: hypothetical protein IPO92_11635 [Saprospiraceae bacterium]|nr:hypothetical protein [Saprospiraceae bacterium]
MFSVDLLNHFNEKLGGNFFKAKDSITKIDLTIQNIKSYVTESYKEGARNSVSINDLLAEFEKDERNYSNEKDITEKEIKNSLDKSKFNYLCLFSGMYSILMLLFGGFDIVDILKDDHVAYLFYLNLLIIVSLLILMTDYFEMWATNHVSTTITFCITIFFAIILIFFCSQNNFHWCPFFPNIVVLSSILIACWHFFMYFIKIYINQKRKGTELVTITSRWDSSSRDLNGRLSVAINVSSEFKRTTIKPRQKKASTPE